MHHSKLSSIIIDCDNLEAGVNFWSQALGTEVSRVTGPYTWLRMPPGHLGIGIQAVTEPKTAKSRVHLDFETDDLEAEVQRLEALGAQRQQRLPDWWVMHDPCGNEFCVVAAKPAELGNDVQTWE